MQTTQTFFTAGPANKAQAGMHSCQPGDPKTEIQATALLSPTSSNPQRPANIRLTLLLLLTFVLPPCSWSGALPLSHQPGELQTKGLAIGQSAPQRQTKNLRWTVKDVTAAVKGEVGGKWTVKLVQRWDGVTGVTTSSSGSSVEPGEEFQIVEIIGEFSPPGNRAARVEVADILLTAPPPRGWEQDWTGREQVSRLGLFQNGACTYGDLRSFQDMRPAGAERFGPLEAASGTMTLLDPDGQVVGDIQFSIDREGEPVKVLISKPTRLCLAFTIPQGTTRTPSLHFANTALTVSVKQQAGKAKPSPGTPVPVAPPGKQRPPSPARHDYTKPYLTDEKMARFIESMKENRDPVATFLGRGNLNQFDAFARKYGFDDHDDYLAVSTRIMLAKAAEMMKKHEQQAAQLTKYPGDLANLNQADLVLVRQYRVQLDEAAKIAPWP